MRKTFNRINLLLIMFVFWAFLPSALFSSDINNKSQLLENYKRNWQISSKDRKKETGKIYVEQLIVVADEYLEGGKLSEAIQSYTRALRMIPNYAVHRKYEVRRKLKNAKNSQTLKNQIEQYSRLLDKNPDNIIIRRKLILTYIIEFDCPAGAKKLLTIDMSEELRTYVPFADKNPNKIAKEVCLELGDWYKSLASKATLRGKGNVLSRAKMYYKRFVTIETDAVKRTSSEAKLNYVDKELQKLGMPWAKHFTLVLGRGVTLKLALIPAGTFMMGSPDSDPRAENEEKPQHKVVISKSFYMGVTEVTRKQWNCVMKKNLDNIKSPNIPMPVSWDDTTKFCKKLSENIGRPVRLPTEAEWQYGCRAGSNTIYCFGDKELKLQKYAWFNSNRVHDVGQKNPNAWGLHDMHGNVWEWCRDWHNTKYYVSNNNWIDPAGPLSGSFRVLCGGCSSLGPVHCRSAARGGSSPSTRRTDFGFRIVVLCTKK